MGTVLQGGGPVEKQVESDGEQAGPGIWVACGSFKGSLHRHRASGLEANRGPRHPGT